MDCACAASRAKTSCYYYCYDDDHVYHDYHYHYYHYHVDYTFILVVKYACAKTMSEPIFALPETYVRDVRMSSCFERVHRSPL